MTMYRINLMMAVGLMFMILGASNLYADGAGGDPDIIIAHPLAGYPAIQRCVETDSRYMLSKDNIETIRKFYEGKKMDGDRIELFKTDSEEGFRLMYHRTLSGKKKSIMELEAAVKKDQGNLHPALGELKAQAMMGGKHSMDEYAVLERKYKHLAMAYYKDVDDGDGGMGSQGEIIYRKAFKQSRSKNTIRVGDSEKAEGRARNEDMKKKMQEMKAKGDYAGMMALAQGASKSARQTTPGAAAMDAMNNDTWDLWVTCLKDLDAAAFRTRLAYADGVLK